MDGRGGEERRGEERRGEERRGEDAGWSEFSKGYSLLISPACLSRGCVRLGHSSGDEGGEEGEEGEEGTLEGTVTFRHLDISTSRLFIITQRGNGEKTKEKEK